MKGGNRNKNIKLKITSEFQTISRSCDGSYITARLAWSREKKHGNIRLGKQFREPCPSPQGKCKTLPVQKREGSEKEEEEEEEKRYRTRV